MITDPQAIRFTNEVIRVKAEQVRALKAEIDSAMAAWFGGINSLIPNSAEEALDDGRESEGVSRLTGADINALVTQLAGIQTALNAAGVADVISKPCVRPLSAS